MRTESRELVERAIEEYGGRPERPYTFIYFVQAMTGGPIKIGRGDPMLRLKGIQNGNPLPLRLTRVVVDQGVEEQRLHAVFAEFRMQGEWFQPHPVLASIADAIPDETLAHLPIRYGERHLRSDTVRSGGHRPKAPGLRYWYDAAA